MKPTTAEEFANLAQELELVSAAHISSALDEIGGTGATVEQLGAHLLRREVLTNYQLDRLLRGDRRGFFYGSAKILYQVGAGSFARVYRAVNVNDGGILAVKVMRSRFAADPEKCKSFRREGEMGRLLRHPNIVAIEDVGLENNTNYITMEFVEGQTLRELIRIRGAVDVGRGIDLLQQLSAGLEYAHRRGVTHRDIKASNVLVSSLGRAKLADFGLAGIDVETGDKALGKVDHPRTLDYAALEKLAGMKDDSIRSDVFFLGTMGYLALSGVSALLESRDRSERSNPARFTSMIPLATRAPHLPRDIVDVISRMLHLDPQERWQTVSDVCRALEPLAEKYPMRAGTLTPSTAAGTPAADAAAVPDATAPHMPARKSTVMLVETTGKSQETLREFFGKLGYKVLVTENPQRALARFSTTPVPADCLVLSAHALGDSAIDAFNVLSKDVFFSQVPAILLIASKQREAASRAVEDSRRKVLQTPFHAADMSKLLGELIGRPA